MNKRKITLVKLRIKADNIKIIDSLLKFNSRNVKKLSINSFSNSGETVEVRITLTVNSGNKDCFKDIKRLNKFLTKENIINKFGYSEITTIPATYEVIING